MSGNAEQAWWQRWSDRITGRGHGRLAKALRREVAELRAELQRGLQPLDAELRRINESLINLDVGDRRNLRFQLDRFSVRGSAELVQQSMLEAAAFGHPLGTLEHALSLAPGGGLALEFGVFSGSTLRVIAKQRGDGRVWGFDSFQGLPEAWRSDFPAGAFATDNIPQVDGAELVIGWFNETLPGFLATHEGPVDFLHIDCDLYSSTKTVFDLVAPRLRPGSVILFDEFFNYPGWEQHEYRAWNELVERTGLRFRYEAYTFNNEQVALRILDSSGAL